MTTPSSKVRFARRSRGSSALEKAGHSDPPIAWTRRWHGGSPPRLVASFAEVTRVESQRPHQEPRVDGPTVERSHGSIVHVTAPRE